MTKENIECECIECEDTGYEDEICYIEVVEEDGTVTGGYCADINDDVIVVDLDWDKLEDGKPHKTKTIRFSTIDEIRLFRGEEKTN